MLSRPDHLRPGLFRNIVHHHAWEIATITRECHCTHRTHRTHGNYFFAVEEEF
jgi:hypothetical protein